MKIVDLVFVACMGPPGGGRAYITNRYMRHFNIVTYTELKDDSISLIYVTILNDFLAHDFSADLQAMAGATVSATIELYNSIARELLPTPEKSHYTFNLRDISKVIQGPVALMQYVLLKFTLCPQPIP